jgi:hypothetical protein
MQGRRRSLHDSQPRGVNPAFRVEIDALAAI